MFTISFNLLHLVCSSAANDIAHDACKDAEGDASQVGKAKTGHVPVFHEHLGEAELSIRVGRISHGSNLLANNVAVSSQDALIMSEGIKSRLN